MSTPGEASSEKTLATLLSTLRQGDLISLGAVTIIGRGPSTFLAASGVAEGSPEFDEVWSLTAESSVGWYVILSQDCDIVRAPEVEPCLMVCPLEYIDYADWLQLRHGPYSPREFPYPNDKLSVPSGKGAVVDARIVTSMEKRALLSDAVSTLRPLTGGQHERFSAWLARRFDRAAHNDLIDQHVLRPSAAVISTSLRKAALDVAASKSPTAAGRVCSCVDEWLIGGNDRMVRLVAVTSPATLRSAGLVNEDGELDEDMIESGRKWLEAKMRSKLPSGGGYVLSLEIRTLDVMRGDEIRGLAEWVLDHPGDPLA